MATDDLLAGVLWERDEIRHTKPVVDPEVWDDVPHEQVREPVLVSDKSKDRGCDGKTEVGQEDQVLVLLLVKRTAGQEVVDAAIAVLLADTLALRLLGVVVVASHVLKEVHWPSTKLLNQERNGSVDWSLLHQLVHLVQKSTSASGVLLTGAWEEDHVALHVSGGLVVLSVADLPAEVWHQESGMAEPSHGVVQSLAGRERLVPAFVSQHPQTRSEKSLKDGVTGPQSCA